MAQPYDSVSKYVILEYPEAIAKLAFGDQNVEIEGSLATEQFTVKASHIDIALKVRLPDGTRGILHIEVQTCDSREPMLYRIASYHGHLFREHKMPIYCCVIYLDPNAGRTDPGYYACEVNGYKYVIQYKVIRLIEIDGQAILEAQPPGLLTLTPLMKRPKRMDANRWLGECVKAIKTADVAPEDLPNLLSILGIFSSLVYDPEQIRQHIPEGIMHEFPIIQQFVEEAETKGLQRGIERGIEQGIEQGERKATIESILAFLGTRFHPNAVQILRPNLETIDDLPRLKELLLAAPYAENFEEFAQTLHE